MVNLVTVVGENTHMLPHMLKHYEDMVDRIYVCVYRQGKDDGILEEIEELGITPYKVYTEEKYNWNKVTEIYNTVTATKPNDWWIVADDDELQVYPLPLDQLTRHGDEHGLTYFRGGFLDRIGPNGTFPKVTRDTNIHEAFPLAGFFRYPMSGACPNKITLKKGRQKITSGQHYAQFDDGTNSWGPASYEFIHQSGTGIHIPLVQVHHFKWDSTCIERIKKVAEVKKEYSYSDEYQIMYDAIKDSNWKIDIKKNEYLVEELKELSYIDYNDYPHWEQLISKIIKV